MGKKTFEWQFVSGRVVFKIVSGYPGQMSIDTGDGMAREKRMQMEASQPKNEF